MNSVALPRPTGHCTLPRSGGTSECVMRVFRVSLVFTFVIICVHPHVSRVRASQDCTVSRLVIYIILYIHTIVHADTESVKHNICAVSMHVCVPSEKIGKMCKEGILNRSDSGCQRGNDPLTYLQWSPAPGWFDRFVQGTCTIASFLLTSACDTIPSYSTSILLLRCNQTYPTVISVLFRFVI